MRSIIVFLSLSLSASAGALDLPDPSQLHRAQGAGHDPLDCYCRAQGRMFAPGEQVCLRTADGPRLAQCRMEINVMSWSVTETPCPEA